MGSSNLKKATEVAILNTNYMKTALDPYYTITDVNEYGRVGHEFIIDLAEFNKYNITEFDISKRLIDYSIHPGTMAWPRKSVIMIEPTESESKKEIDRFIEAMISIKNEINEIIMGEYDTNNNILKNSPHSLSLLDKEWIHPYTTKKAFYPIDSLVHNKHFPSVNRVNDVIGDKNLLSFK